LLRRCWICVATVFGLMTREAAILFCERPCSFYLLFTRRTTDVACVRVPLVAVIVSL